MAQEAGLLPGWTDDIHAVQFQMSCLGEGGTAQHGLMRFAVSGLWHKSHDKLEKPSTVVHTQQAS